EWGDGGGGEARARIDMAVAVEGAALADRRIRCEGLRSLARQDVAVGAEQVDVAALLGHDAALVDQDRTVGEGADGPAGKREDALLRRRERIAGVVADDEVSARSKDIDIAAELGLEQGARDVEIAGRN